MIKTTYYCDCCKEVIPDGAAHIQLLPTTGGSPFVERAAGYEHMEEAHFCQGCTDRIIGFAFNPVDAQAMQKSVDEDKAIIETLNAELEAAKAVDPEELERMKAKNDAMAGKIAKQDTLIQSLREEIEKLKGEEPPAEEVPKPRPARVKVKRPVPADKAETAGIDKAAVYRMYRDGMSYKEIAERIGKTSVRVGQIVREMIENERLSD